MAKIKITPLFILLLLLEVVLLFGAINYLLIENNGGMALGGIIALIAAFINAIVIVLEQVIANIKGVNNKMIWAIELLIIACAVIFIAIYGISIG
jgi:hypothetical protein